MTMYKSTVNAHVWAWSKFNSCTNFVPLMTNDGSLPMLSGSRINTKCVLAKRFESYKKNLN